MPSLHWFFESVQSFSNLAVTKIHKASHRFLHGLRTPGEEIAFTARPKIQSQSQIFRYGGSIFCLPHRPNFSDIFDLCLHWVSVVRGLWLIFFLFLWVFWCPLNVQWGNQNSHKFRKYKVVQRKWRAKKGHVYFYGYLFAIYFPLKLLCWFFSWVASSNIIRVGLRFHTFYEVATDLNTYTFVFFES